MTTFKKITAVALTSLTIAVAFAPSAEARWRGRHTAIAAGVIGGAVLGAALAGSYSRPAYARPVYAQPVYAEPEYDCYRRHAGYGWDGRPIYRTICR